jgi:hypothetical protein
MAAGFLLHLAYLDGLVISTLYSARRGGLSIRVNTPPTGGEESGETRNAFELSVVLKDRTVIGRGVLLEHASKETEHQFQTYIVLTVFYGSIST